MKNKLKSLSKQEWLSFIGIFLVTLGDYFYHSWIDAPYRKIIGIPLITVGSIIFVIDIIKNIKNKLYTPKQLKIIGILMLVGAISWHRISVFYVSIFMAVYFLNKDLKFMFKSLFISMLIGMCLIIFLNIVGVIPDHICTRQGDGEILYRYGLGFKHPNVVYKYYVAMIMCGAIVLKNNRWFLMSSYIIGLILYFYTYSRMGLIILTILFGLCMLPKKLRRKTSFNQLIPYFFVAGFIVSIVTAFLFKENDFVNSVLSGRPEIWDAYLEDVGVIGRFHQIDESMPLDNRYLHILCFGGIYGLIIYIAIHFLAYRNSKTQNNYNLFMIGLITLLYGYIENFSRQNEAMLLILVFMMLLDKNKMEELQENSLNENSSKD